MDALSATIRETRPDAPELRDLFDRHLGFTRSTSPACSVHSREPEELAASGAIFFVLESGGKPKGMGALVEISKGHGEIKSMHVLDAVRGQGVGRSILAHIVDRARSEGMVRLSLETGAQPGFAAARALYSRAGFVVTGPFGGYREDPNSVFMTLGL